MMELPICRICLSDETQTDLVSPCECKGTIAYVHETCLNKWRMMHHATIRQDVCQLCMTAYRVKGDRRVTLYRIFVRTISLASLVPLSFLAAEIMPRLPRRTQGVDVLGLDVLPWQSEAFGWLLDSTSLSQISSIIEKGGGAWETWIKSRKVFPILMLGLAKLGSLGILLRFLFTNNVMGDHQQNHHPHHQDQQIRRRRGESWFGPFSRLTPGQAVFVHYLLSCLSFRCVKTPQTKRDAVIFSFTCSIGLWFVNLIVEDWIRRLVLRIWPTLEVARIVSLNG